MERIRNLRSKLIGFLRRSGGIQGAFRKLVLTLRSEGFAGVKKRLNSAVWRSRRGLVLDELGVSVDRRDYGEWIRRYDTIDDNTRNRIHSKIQAMPRLPRISLIMPAYDPPLEFLDQAIGSVRKQLYPAWELCIADDCSRSEAVRGLLRGYAEQDSRIRVMYRSENGHISRASNSALELATGEFIALLDNDDLLAEHALFCIAEAILANPNAQLVYSDEDKIDSNGLRKDPYFKPDWNPDLFLSHNMICHLGVYRHELVKSLGGFRAGLEGAQDYDLALRCIEQLRPDQIVHIPRVLYHWRSHPGSTALGLDQKNYALLAGERALNDHLTRAKIPGRAELLDFGMYRVRYAVPNPEPLVSLIIPTRNATHLIKQCISSIVAKTSYKNYEIIVIDNGSDDIETLHYFASLRSNKNIRILRDDRPFNYSALNNEAVKHALGEYIGLVNNDIEVISPEWLSEMVSIASQSGVGAVGARLWYPNNTIQHAGCIAGIGGVAGHGHKHLPKGDMGYFARANLIQTLSIVTAACLIVKKCVYEQVGGLDETHLKIAFNDVDFCLKITKAGLRNVWTPYAELYHHESATRGVEDTPEKQARFRDEVLYMLERWGQDLKNDPAYNPNLTLDRDDFSYSFPPRVESL